MPSVDDELATIEAAARQRAERVQLGGQIDTPQADAIGEMLELYPWLTPDTAWALARSGLTAADEAVSVAAGAAAGDKTASPLGWRQPGERVSAGRKRPTAVTVGDDVAEGGKRPTAVTVGEKRPTVLNAGVADSGFLGDVFDTVRDNPFTDNVLEPVKDFEVGGVSLGKAGDAAKDNTIVKGVVRGGTIGLDSIYQSVQATARTTVRSIQDRDAQGLLGTLNPRVLEQTDLGQIVGQVGRNVDSAIDGSGSRNIFGGIETGSGFFINDDYKIGQERNRAELKHGAFQWVDENGKRAEAGSVGARRQALTVGRMGAGIVSEPGTKPYQFLSGLTDAALAIGVDRAGVDKLFAARKAHKGFKSFKAARDANAGPLARAGGIFSHRAALDDKLVEKFLVSGDGRKVIESFAGEKSIRQLDLLTGQKVPPAILAQIADTENVDNITTILRQNLGIGIPTAPGQRRIKNVAISAADRVPTVARMATKMPSHTIDISDGRQTLDTVERYLRNTKSSESEIARWTQRFARAEGQPDVLFDVVKDMTAETFAKIEPEIGEDLGRMLTKQWVDSHKDLRKYFVDEIGENRNIFALDIGGKPVHQPSPHLFVEHLNSNIPLPDARAIRRTISPFRKLLTVGNAKGDLTLPISLMMSLQDEIWKPFQLLRGAWPARIIPEEQLRIGAAGFSSSVANPMSWIAWASSPQGGKLSRALDKVPGLDSRGETDLFGELFALSDDYMGAMADEATFGLDVGKIRTDHMTTFSRGSDGYVDGMALEVSQLASDPVARNLVRNAELHEVKAQFWDGPLQIYRKQLAKARKEPGLDLLTRADADRYIDETMERIRIKTGGNPELLSVIANGKYPGGSVFTRGTSDIDPSFIKWLDTHKDSGPDKVKGWITATARGDKSKTAARKDAVVRQMFSFLMASPTNDLSRSPFFKQVYWARAREIAGRLDPADADMFVESARKAGLNRGDIRQIDYLAKKQSDIAELSLHEVDAYAKGHALDETKQLLYDLSEKGQGFDAFRLVFPFGDAWQEVITRWAKLLGENPNRLRKLDYTLDGARDAGVFVENEHGEEVFVYPFTGAVTEKLLGVPVPLTGRVEGLSMVSEVFPSTGPVAQVPLKYLIPADDPAWDGVREFLFPFGEPEDPLNPGSFVENEVLPPWAKRTLQGLAVKTGVRDPDDIRLFANSVDQVSRYLASTGEYDLHGDDAAAETARMLDDAKDKAAWFTMIRGAFQFGAPSAPSPRWLVEDVNGERLMTVTLIEDYRRLLEEDFESAPERFLELHGEDNFLVMQGFSFSISGGGLPPTKEAKAWLFDNKGIDDEFRLSYGFFAPKDTEHEFDYQVYLDSFEKGDRAALTTGQFLRLGQARLGRQQYNKAREEVQSRMDADGRKTRTTGERQFLVDTEAQLKKEYPGYQDNAGLPRRASVEQIIDEMALAVEDDRLRDEPMAVSVRTYLDARVEAKAKAVELGLAGFSSAQAASGLRLFLVDTAAALTAENPGFAEVFEFVFEREIRAGLDKDEKGLEAAA